MLPQDGNILLSFVNMKLRDGSGCLADFCAEQGVEEADLLEKLSAAGYRYDPSHNQFVRK